ncbi:Asp23/Gls24 family envelope stress response protein [Lacticaseibacillus baoqingensis]|uniref:Stress response regulator gls24 homolog n=1 Tax=Lacticaseibacillus baoqingensis TaxID=2486013 RepID=A0ABW4E796_9LACO|nr:Asp23/Gls24 family envelope stress response protein [Lacticaseibacillus baoqingensis]
MTEHNLHFDDHVLEKIVALTAQEIPGVYRLEGNLITNVADKLRKTPNQTKGVAIDMPDDDHVQVTLDAILHYGQAAQDVFAEVTEAITERVLELTGLTVDKIDMTVKDMLTDAEIAEQENKDRDQTDAKADPKAEKTAPAMA